MATPKRVSWWTTDLPEAWPEVPAQMTVTTLAEIEACPYRWALGVAEYPGLWAGRGYPPRVHLSALAGTVVHLVLETITMEFVRAGCPSVQNATAPQVMKSLGGYTRVVDGCIDRVLQRLARSPRATKLLDFASRSLRAQIPDLRARAQTMLSHVQLPQVARGNARGRRPKSRGPLTAGVFPEIELRATQMSWRGKADLLVLSPDACEITDFKTGAQDEGHRFQIQVYALLWSRDNELNPDRRLADRLILRYPGRDVEVAAPTAPELDDLERHIVARRDAAHQAVSQRPPEARPDAERCRYCDIRQLCDTYWTAETQRLLAAQAGDRRFTDIHVTITGRHGPSSWDALIELSRDVPPGKRAVVRTSGEIQFRAGDRLRVLDVGVTVDSEDEAQPVVITLGTLSEVYSVA